jgi:excisionase family DNA binding protein
MEPVFLTVEETAGVLRISRTRVFDLIRTNRLRSSKFGRVRRIPVSAIREFAKACEQDQEARRG